MLPILPVPRFPEVGGVISILSFMGRSLPYGTPLQAGTWLTNSTFDSSGTFVSGGDTNFGLLFKDKNGRLATGDGTLYWDVEGDEEFARPNMLYIGGPNTGNTSGFALWDDSYELYVGFYTDGAGVWQITKSDGTYITSLDIGSLNANGSIGGQSLSILYPTAGGNSRITAHASQTGDLLAWKSSAAAIYSRFNKAGYFMTRKVAAPADGDLVASELAIWFDDTNGAGKAMFKGKTANGTVVTGSVTLT